ncbi:Hypothetical predicted protein [Cloeon dipterum]|uniref:Uncharacterized protein n=1 Tax=Cloeon dipterum TaxID=197152 RepID=A0A8S1DTL4_9INSE|nr:Hypothetical predicted protein [Cloeon dipterum]
MPSWMHIHNEEALEEYHELYTPLNPIFYPAILPWDTSYITGFYDSANRRSSFVRHLVSGDDDETDVSETIDDYNFLLLCDKENELEWRQHQPGNAINEHVATNNIGIPVYFGRVRVGYNNVIGEVREDGNCYIPTPFNDVIRVLDFEILRHRDIQQ